jgi:hypothetical protein
MVMLTLFFLSTILMIEDIWPFSIFLNWVESVFPQKKVQKITPEQWNASRFNKYKGPILEINYPGGERYKGQMKEGRKHGEGQLYLANGETYDGLFKEDLFSGEGKIVHQDRTMYIGQWMKGKKNGIGLFFYEDGTHVETGKHIFLNPKSVEGRQKFSREWILERQRRFLQR